MFEAGKQKQRRANATRGFGPMALDPGAALESRKTTL
jgi:hypothetical protein